MLTSQQMIKCILLPISTRATKHAIDLASGEMLPRFALVHHRIMVWECHQNVDMIGHDDKVSEQISLIVKMMQAICNHLGNLGITKVARSMTFVQSIHPPIRDVTLERYLLVVRQLNFCFVGTCLISGQTRLNQPSFPFALPLSQNSFGHGIVRSPGDEADHAGLLPMG